MRRASAAPILAVLLVASVLTACSAASSATQAASTGRSVPTARSTTTTSVGGATWSSPVPVAHGAALDAVECLTPTFCLALGSNGNSFRYNGTAWSPTGTVGIGTEGAPSLSCAGPSFCVTTSQGDNQVGMWNGRAFGPPTSLPAHGLEAIGCATPSFCVTIDGLGDAYYFDGSSWSNEANDWGSVVGLSCPTTTFCVSIGGGISMWNGQSWTRPQSFGLSTKLAGLSCPSSGFCQVADVTGQVDTWNGSAWSGSQPIPTTGGAAAGAASGAAGLSGLSCATSTFCVALDASGEAHTWNGSTWSLQVADRAAALNAVSCSSTTFCVAVDQLGNAIVYR